MKFERFVNPMASDTYGISWWWWLIEFILVCTQSVWRVIYVLQ